MKIFIFFKPKYKKNNVVKFYSQIFANLASCVSRMRIKIQLTHNFMYYTNIIYDDDDGLKEKRRERGKNIYYYIEWKWKRTIIPRELFSCLAGSECIFQLLSTVCCVFMMMMCLHTTLLQYVYFFLQKIHWSWYKYTKYTEAAHT